MFSLLQHLQNNSQVIKEQMTHTFWDYFKIWAGHFIPNLNVTSGYFLEYLICAPEHTKQLPLAVVHGASGHVSVLFPHLKINVCLRKA